MDDRKVKKLDCGFSDETLLGVIFFFLPMNCRYMYIPV